MPLSLLTQLGRTCYDQRLRDPACAILIQNQGDQNVTYIEENILAPFIYQVRVDYLEESPPLGLHLPE